MAHSGGSGSPRWLLRLIGLVAVTVSLVACLPAPQPLNRPLPRALVQSPQTTASADPALRDFLSLPPAPFEENRGQADERVAYLARAGGLTAFYQDGGVSYRLTGYDPAETDAATVAGCETGRKKIMALEDGCGSPPAQRRWWLSQQFVGARVERPLAAEPAETVVSYFVGKEGFIGRSNGWVTGVPTYQQLVYREAWPGIDVSYERNGARGLKSSYHVQPGADPSVVRVLWRGSTASIAEEGALVLATPLGELRESAPIAWQEIGGRRTPVRVAYQILSLADADDAALAETEVGFMLGAYDPSRPLVIDPLLEYATYLGGGGNDVGTGIAIDGNGAAYIAGTTDSTETTFPNGGGFGAVPGFDQTYNGGNNNAFVAKLNASGTGLIYATYVGGISNDVGRGVAVDGSGNAYMTGFTSSTEGSFPDGDPNNNNQMDVPGFDQTHNGGVNDAFVVKLNPDGTDLVYATYVGGNDRDEAYGIAVDAGGNAYVTGLTGSTEMTFPNGGGFGTGAGQANVPGFDQTHNGSVDAFVVKLNPGGTGLVYATYVGGRYFDVGLGIAVDGSGNAFITGETASFDGTFPNGVGFGAVPGFDQTYNGGNVDAFVVKLNASGTDLFYATYLGGNFDETGRGIAVDGGGNAYITGDTKSTQASFPNGSGFGAVPGLDQTHNSGLSLLDAFVVKLNPGGTALVYATYLGGSGDDSGNSIAVDGGGNAYVTGVTGSTEMTFPNGGGFGTGSTQANVPGFDQTHNGSLDAFVVKLNPSGMGLVYATYIGGSGDDEGYGIAIDGNGHAYIAGTTGSTETTFPNGNGFGIGAGQVDVPGFDQTYNGGYNDAFVVRLDDPPNTPTPTPTPTSTSTPTPTPTHTPTPGVCAPRPPVGVQVVAVGGGRLRVTLSIGTAPATPGNRLVQVRFGSVPNAVVEDAGGVSPPPAPPAGATTQTFFVRRTGPGAVTLPLTVVDLCGDWRTFVGGGPTAI